MKIKGCIDCGCKITPIHLTGSFQCDSCRNELITRLRKIAGRFNRETTKEKVKRLTKKGYTANKISEITDIHISSVYNYRKA